MKILRIGLIALLLSSCATQETLTPQQVQQQQQIDGIIADTLFDAGLNEKASYEVTKEGDVTLLFTSDVSEKQYTEVVNQLRSDPRIPSIYAEQDNKQVCPLR
ncbi:hypothetical protein [Thiomicrorhabdus sp.]|uniref:hypothetical protein n=1 Tax=Thiomicrorhabdus sp. TaxID=2039724 RepID=UPI0029C9ABDD|nr:hypothetical protein [Thiomicrorhabdus sp.]